MYDKKLYEIAYALKEEDQGINSMNELCTKIEDEVSVNDIVDLLKLYSDNATNSEQNEFVTKKLPIYF